MNLPPTEQLVMSWFLFITVSCSLTKGVTFHHFVSELEATTHCPRPFDAFTILCRSVGLQSAGLLPRLSIRRRSPFLPRWPVAMSQRQWSEVSTPRHNTLSGKNNSLMPQSSFIVWDDSDSGEAYCWDVFVVHIHCWGMWGFPPLRVFLDLCVNSRQLCIMLCCVGSLGEVCALLHMCGNLCVCSYVHRK